MVSGGAWPPPHRSTTKGNHMFDNSDVTRRDLLVRSGLVAGGFVALPSAVWAALADLDAQEVVVPWVERPPEPGRTNVLNWEDHAEYVTPVAKQFRVGHYGTP